MLVAVSRETDGKWLTACDCGGSSVVRAGNLTSGNSESCGCRRRSERRPEADRFWALVEKGDGCWTWKGAADGYGYGCFQTKRKVEKAHRVSYRLATGQPAGDLDVCHKCDNPPCVRPDHLFLGTAGDNVRDMVAKGRHFMVTKPELRARGERHGAAKITAADAAAIRGSSEPAAVLAAKYGVTRDNVNKIRKGLTWSDGFSNRAQKEQAETAALTAAMTYSAKVAR